MGAKYVVVGDPWGTNGGAVHIFAFDGKQLAKINPTDGVANDFFGESVGVDERTIVVGAPRKTGPAGVYQGAAYAYDYYPLPPLTKLFEAYSLCKRCPPVCLSCPVFELPFEEAINPAEIAALPPDQREFVLGLHLSKIGRLINDERVGREIQQTGLKMIKKAVEGMQ